MFNRLRARISLLRAKRLFRLARRDSAKADKNIFRKENTTSTVMSPRGIAYVNSAMRKNSKANALVWKSRVLRKKIKKRKQKERK